jgi:hypothetical protein
MTVQNTSHDQQTSLEQPRTFVSLKEVNPTLRPEQTDEEIKAWVMEQLRADKKVLDLLATL